jgi:flagellar hook-associated protein 1 FlgK
VLGTEAATVKVGSDDFGDTLKNKLAITRNGIPITMDENLLGGGEVSGLLRFQNADLAEGRNLLGRITMALTTSLNDQHKLGLDLDGAVGGNLFNPVTFSGANVMKPVAPATLNTGNAELTLSISDPTKFVASDYEVNFTSATTGNITRRADGVIISFPQTPATTAPVIATLDGISISMPAPTNTPVAGDRFLLKPFSTAANGVTSQFSTPRALAVASSIATSAGTTNKGSLAVASLATKTMATPVNNYSINFTGTNTYDIVDNTTATTVAPAQTFTPGQAITYNPGGTAGWSLTLTGAAAVGDTITVKANPYTTLSAGNATAMMNLRDTAMFDGAALTDGYAGMISQIGIRTQSANYAATVSTSIASNLERDRTGVSGVNLDEEGAKLLQYQQAYQASAKMIQIAQNIFDTLIQGLGR